MSDKCLVCGKPGEWRVLIPLGVYCDKCAERRYKALLVARDGGKVKS